MECEYSFADSVACARVEMVHVVPESLGKVLLKKFERWRTLESRY